MAIPKRLLKNVKLTNRGSSNKRRYVTVTGHPIIPDGTGMYYYRYVMVNILGRLLAREESVHHKNGDRTDDAPENLELKRNREHTRGHTLEQWARRTKKERRAIGRKISKAKKGKPQPWAAEVGRRQRGKVRSEKFKKRVSKSMKKYCQKLPPGEMARRGALSKGVPRPPLSAEAKEKIRVCLTGRPKSAETRQRLSAAAKADWAKRKARQEGTG